MSRMSIVTHLWQPRFSQRNSSPPLLQMTQYVYNSRRSSMSTTTDDTVWLQLQMTQYDYNRWCSMSTTTDAAVWLQLQMTQYDYNRWRSMTRTTDAAVWLVAARKVFETFLAATRWCSAWHQYDYNRWRSMTRTTDAAVWLQLQMTQYD